MSVTSEMDADHSSQSTNKDSAPSAPKRRKRNVNHVSRACDGCRLRKTRCDGQTPICGICSEKGLTCSYDRGDGRKNRNEIGDLRSQISTLMELLNTKTGVLHAPNPTNTGTSSTSPGTLAGIVGQSSTFGNLNIPLGDAVTDSIDSQRREDMPIQGGVPIPTSKERRSSQIGEFREGGMSPIETLQGSPVTSLSDRLKRIEPSSLMQIGPTSLWSYAPESTNNQAAPSVPRLPDLKPGDWVDWARCLPPDLNISKSVHDTALSYFGAYYAPWCMVADMPAFLRDLEVCNLVTRVPRTVPAPYRTSAYSPLLHNCALHLGLHLQRQAWPDVAQAMDAVIDKHCASMVTEESEDPNPNSLRALALFASCMNVRKDKSARNTGYIYFGMAFASVQALGVNLKCDHLVNAGHISTIERDQRNASYWTIYQQDLLRAIAVGRPPMLNAQTEVPLPAIDPNTDNMLWSPHNTAIGLIGSLKSMRSTVFHWSARLACLLRRVIDTSLYTSSGEASYRDLSVISIAHELETWYREQPFPQPSSHPVPHLLLMHMLYHLTHIYLFRPYFRSALSINPAPAYRCDQAAQQIASLLRVYDSTHGLRNGVATLIPIVFGMATIRLLVLVSDQVDPTNASGHAEGLEESTHFMSQLAVTWIEAQRGLEVINALKSDWLPDLSHPLDYPFGSQVEGGASVPDLNHSDLSNELEEWLLGSGFYDMPNVNTLPSQL